MWFLYSLKFEIIMFIKKLINKPAPPLAHTKEGLGNVVFVDSTRWQAPRRKKRQVRVIMTELEMAMTLGLVTEPEKNFVKVDPVIIAEIQHMKHIFVIAQDQHKEIGRLNPDVWMELLPWHSLN